MSNRKELVDAAELLDRLPRTMRYETVESLTMETLAKVPLFARVEEGFMHALTQKMQAINCSIGETLVRQGDINENFYIVLKGRLSVETVRICKLISLASQASSSSRSPSPTL